MSQRSVGDLGGVIRRIRKSRRMTATDLAEATGMSPSYISQVERGLIIPSVPALHQLGEALDVPTFYFFVEEEAPHIVVRANERKIMQISSTARYELASPSLYRNMQVVECHLKAGESTAEEPFFHKGEEVAYVIRGEVEATVDGRTFMLSAGDCAQFEARLPHRYRNVGDDEAILLFCISPPM